MRIGIPGWENDGFFGVSSNYMVFAEIVGKPIVLSQDSDSNLAVDGILLPGGSDVNPARYGVPGFFVQKSNPYLEWFDTAMLPEAISSKIPVFGICRGLQTLNVRFGGTLIQNLLWHPYSQHTDDLVHQVVIAKQSEIFKVNSFHHQAVKDLGRNLQVLAVSKQDGIVEAIRHENLPIAAVQWHPERMWDNFSINLFKSLF